MNNIIKRVWNQNRMVNIEDLSGMAFQAEDGGHTFEISGVNDAGETVELSGTVSGVFMRPDLADIAIVGSATDGVVSVTLPADCYAVNGRFALTIFVTSDSQKVAVYAAVGTVTRTSGGAVAGDTPQDVVDLINAINAAVNSIPADLTNLMGAIAQTYSSSALYAKGAYAWYDGVLYRCTTAITTAESWTAAHWTAAVLGDDVADLKSAILQMQDGFLVFDLISGSYVKTNGEIAEYAGWSRTDYIDCEGYNTLYVESAVGIASIYNCFYDENKTRLSNFTVGFTDSPVIIAIPPTAKYFMLSNATSYIKSYRVKLAPTVSDIANGNKTILNEIVYEDSNTVTASTSGVTKNPTTGYLRSNDGAFVSHASYQCYYFTMASTENVWFDNPSGWHQIAVYNGDAFDTTKFVTIKTSSAGNLPTSENPLVIASGMTVVVCVAVNTNFALYVGNGELYAKTKSTAVKIKIIPKYATQFSVEVLDEESGKYITYWFFHTTFTDTMEYGDSQTKDVVTYDVWFNNNINDADGNLIFQGNTNFIHALSDIGHIGHVGAGHGCTVMDCYQFFADGKPFEPSTLSAPIYCTDFRFVIKAKHYLIDDSITTSASHAMPVLDENGDPIVTSEWVYDGTWTVNNRVEMRNHLEIKRDNTTFRQCHGGMLCGFYPNVDNVMLSGRKGLYWNSTNGTTSTDKSSSGVTFTAGATTSIIADSATLFGDTYVARQDFWQYDPEMYGKNNVLAWMPPNSDGRLKMYLMPCVCTESTALIDEGKNVDVFNSGDSIDLEMVRTIGIAPN